MVDGRLGVRGPCREREREFGAVLVAGLHDHLPAVRLRDRSHDEQAEPDAARGGVFRGDAAHHGLEEAAQGVPGDGVAVVVHGQAGDARLHRGGDRDGAARRAIGHGVAHEVAQELGDAVRVGADLSATCGCVLDRAAGEGHRELLDDPRRELVEVRGAARDAQARAQAHDREIEQVGDEALGALPGAGDVAQHARGRLLRGGRGRGRLAGEHVGSQEDGGERVAHRRALPVQAPHHRREGTPPRARFVRPGIPGRRRHAHGIRGHLQRHHRSRTRAGPRGRPRRVRRTDDRHRQPRPAQGAVECGAFRGAVFGHHVGHEVVLAHGPLRVQAQQDGDVGAEAPPAGGGVQVPHMDGPGLHGLPQARAGRLQGLLRLPLLGHHVVGALAGGQQFALVLVAFLGHHHGDLVEGVLAAGAAHHVEQGGEGAAVAAADVELDLRDGALHCQHGLPVGLVEDPAAHGEKLLQLLLPYQFVRGDAGPLAQGPVDLEDQAGRAGHQQPAGHAVEEFFRFYHPIEPRNSSITTLQAPGALRCGQCPTFSITRSMPRGRWRSM